MAALSSVVVGPARAAEGRAAASQATGSVTLDFGPSFVRQMFAGGLFMYGASSVSVGMGDSGDLAATFPLAGGSSATPTTLIRVDGETGGLTIFNGPAQTTASLTSLVVRRSGDVGGVVARILGPLTPGLHYDQTMPTFALSSVRTKTSSTGWTMTAHMAVTERGAAALNTLLRTSIFRAGERIGSLRAEVGADLASAVPQ